MSISNSLLKAVAVDARAVVARTASCEDLNCTDGIQMYVRSSASQAPRRLMGADPILSVNLKMNRLSRGFYAKQQRIVSGLSGAENFLHDGLSQSPQTMELVVPLSDLRVISVTTYSGEEYVMYMERAANPRVWDIKKLICEREGASGSNDLQLVLAGVPLDDQHLVNDLDSHYDTGVLNSYQLHLVVQKNARVHARPNSEDRAMELPVRAMDSSRQSKLLPATAETDDVLGVPSMSLSYQSTSLVQPTGLGNHPSLRTDALSTLVNDVEMGLLAGRTPHLTSDGSGGTYLMSDSSGSSTSAVFKPMDEEPLAVNCPRGMSPSLTGEGLKRGTRVGEGAYREVAAYLLDHPLREGESEGFAGVPPTTLVRCSSSVFSHGDSPRTPLDPVDAGKVGSLQHFVKSVSNCEDMGPSRFPAEEVHKIAVLDMRLANTDRNGANILVQKIEGTSPLLKLIPIDHGYCIPEKFEDTTFEWLYWPQSKVPFNKETLEYISKLDANSDIAMLQESGWTLRPACIKVLQAATMLLKKGAAAGKTAFEIGSLMVRDDPDVPSMIEALVEEAEVKSEGSGNHSFGNCLAEAMSAFLR